jgi:hypothetical protein
MSERMSAWIAIGGNVPRVLVPELCQAIIQEQLSQDWDGDAFEPEDEEDLTNALDHEGHLFLCDHEARWGEFDALERFLRQHGIPYDRHSSAKYEYDAQLAQFRPGLGILCDLASEDGRPLVDRDEVEKVRDALRTGKIEEALTLVEKLCPEISELALFQVVDGDIVMLMDDADGEEGHP